MPGNDAPAFGKNEISNNGDDTTNNALQSPNSQDFVIKNGFPCLRRPKPHDASWWLTDDDVGTVGGLPRYSVWAAAHALDLRHHLDTLRHDCNVVFTARVRNDDTAYSAGTTYFLPAAMSPRCALEALVRHIFGAHTAHLADGVMITEQSGAEWWTLVMDNDDDDAAAPPPPPPSSSLSPDDAASDTDDTAAADDDDDEVGLHFDADYGLEDQAPGLLLHPRVATVTYLSDFGAPTLVLDRRMSASRTMTDLAGPILQGWLCHPAVGKHLSFDGRLLHGAPSTFLPGVATQECGGGGGGGGGSSHHFDNNDATPPPSAKRAKHDRRRITLLVNVWINHCPLDAEPLDEDILSTLTSPWPVQFAWRNDLVWHAPCAVAPLTLSSTEQPDAAAGAEETIICQRRVTLYYNAAMPDWHALSQQAARATDNAQTATVACVQFADHVLVLAVGDQVAESDDESDDEGNATSEI